MSKKKVDFIVDNGEQLSDEEMNLIMDRMRTDIELSWAMDMELDAKFFKTVYYRLRDLDATLRFVTGHKLVEAKEKLKKNDGFKRWLHDIDYVEDTRHVMAEYKFVTNNKLPMSYAEIVNFFIYHKIYVRR